MVSHQDHSEHSVNILITEQGELPTSAVRALLKELKPSWELCSPWLQRILWDYMKLSGKDKPHCVQAALGMHAALNRTGDEKCKLGWLCQINKKLNTHTSGGSPYFYLQSKSRPNFIWTNRAASQNLSWKLRAAFSIQNLLIHNHEAISWPLSAFK